MIWTTIQYIKEHSRICCDGEDGVLELYGAAAEKAVMNYLERDYDDIVGTFGTTDQPVPEPIRQATLMLVDMSYQHRSPADVQNLSIVPYGFDVLLKPYMRLSGNYANDRRNNIMKQLVEQAQLLAFYLPDGAESLSKRIGETFTRFALFSSPTPVILDAMQKEVDVLAAEVDALVNPDTENAGS